MHRRLNHKHRFKRSKLKALTLLLYPPSAEYDQTWEVWTRPHQEEQRKVQAIWEPYLHNRRQ